MAGETNNRLLSSDYDEIEDDEENAASPVKESNKQWLHNNVLKLLPTLNALIFAVDATEQNLKLVKSELDVMRRGLKVGKADTPILVLSCYAAVTEEQMQLAHSSNPDLNNEEEVNREPVGVETLVNAINLSSLTRPWAAFSVDIDNMSGLEKALSWVLYHIHKQRIVSQYHKVQGSLS